MTFEEYDFDKIDDAKLDYGDVTPTVGDEWYVSGRRRDGETLVEVVEVNENYAQVKVLESDTVLGVEYEQGDIIQQLPSNFRHGRAAD